MAAALLLLALGGCVAGDRNVFDAPVDLYHDLQGGTIATQRPPPPGVGQPFPELGSVPGRPAPTSAADRRAIYARLLAERERTVRRNAADPVVIGPNDMPRSPAAAPAPPARPAPAAAASGAAAPATAAAADDSAPSVAVLPAAEAPPPPRRAPPPRPEPGPLPELRTAAAGSGPVPVIPDRPPPPPALEGVPSPPGPPGSVNVYFRRGSATVPLDADAGLRELAAGRKDQPIDVRAPGDGRGAAAAGLALGLRRAQAIAAVLADAGVPPGALRVVGTGAGQAGVARVVGRD